MEREQDHWNDGDTQSIYNTNRNEVNAKRKKDKKKKDSEIMK